MNPIGYIVHPEGMTYPPQQGTYYDYHIAGNGVFIEADGKHLSGRAPVAECCIRGLKNISPVLELKHGHIPALLLELAFNSMLASPEKEIYVGIRWDSGANCYRLYLPDQQREPALVSYQVGDDIVLDLHSHGSMPARFSGLDDRDEQGLRLYGVIGRLNKQPKIALRLGIYGYYCPLEISDVFDGNLAAWQIGEEDEL